jgi:hypothetical protein
LCSALSCALTERGRCAVEAPAALSRSADLGKNDADWAARNPHLRSLRDLPEFTAILARMRELAAK